MTNRELIRKCSFNRCVAIFVCMLLGITFCVDTGADVITEPAAITGEKLVDNPVDAWLIAHSGRAGRAVGGDYRRRFEILDTTDFKQGDFSIKFEVSNAAAQSAFGFFTGQYIDYWVLDESFSLHLWVKAEAENNPDKWEVALYDTSGKRAAAQLQAMSANDGWKSFAIALKDMTCDSGFSFEQVRSVQVEAQLDKGACLRLDGVYFTDGKSILGVSDKTITQYMQEAQDTRQKRVEQTLAGWNMHPVQSFYFVPQLYSGENLEEVNQRILEYIENESKAMRPWGLWTASALHWMYFGFSSEGRLKPGHLSEEAEQALLEWMWERTKHKNDIATTRRSSWYIAGSENHDINMKHANLLSSQIFMNLPDYSERIYPNLGRMIGYKYGMNPEFLPDATLPQFKLGSGNFSDGKDYKPKDHYKAWVEFWKGYIAERARHGFFNENNASGYMSHTLRFLHDIYAWCEDEQLREQTRMFFDLIWAQWMQDALITIQGGSTSRGGPGHGRLGMMAEFFMGGPAARSPGDFFALSDYQWTRQHWEIALDRQSKGEFAYISRKPNEEQDIDPRPAGTEYSMLIRPDSRLVRYSWITPDYVMGVRMDHPRAVYAHISGSGQGITFPTTPDARIEFDGGEYTRTVQYKNVVLMQPRTYSEVLKVHPVWFPGYRGSLEPNPIRVWFGDDVDTIVETGGWVFVQEGNAFAAFKIVSPASMTPVGFDEDGFGLIAPSDKAYRWSEQPQSLFRPGQVQGGRLLIADDQTSALIVETSSRKHYDTFEQFQSDILGNELKLKLVIHGFILTYKGSSQHAKELYLNCSNNETPKIADEYISYDSPAFYSPYLQGEFGSGVVRISGSQTGEELILDFNRLSSK